MDMRYRDQMSGLDHLRAVLADLTPEQQRSVLRHPAWHDRCDCRRIGYPHGCDDVVFLFPDTAHNSRLCQPMREYIP
jgi:hypothetical protein